MATLELIRLRSKYPNTGRMTVRHAMPLIDAPMDLDPTLDQALRAVLVDSTSESTTQQTTTPKVALSESSDTETPARKGGQAR